MRKIVLASSSQSRKLLLERLLIPFVTASPDVDESPYEKENPESLVKRLAETKAKTIAKKFPDALIIGADQVGVFENKIVGKPLTIENAKKELLQMSNKVIEFYIGICLLDSKNNAQQTAVEKFDVKYRHLTEKMIDGYLQKEQPLQCAGSCKAEGLGIALIEEFRGKDYTALIGLPLIKLISLFENVGVSFVMSTTATPS